MEYRYEVNPVFLQHATLFSKHLLLINERIVKPLTVQIKELMRTHHLVNEAELFCSDMQYRVEDEQITERYMGEGTRNAEDLLLELLDKIQELKKQFTREFDIVSKLVKEKQLCKDLK